MEFISSFNFWLKPDLYENLIYRLNGFMTLSLTLKLLTTRYQRNRHFCLPFEIIMTKWHLERNVWNWGWFPMKNDFAMEIWHLEPKIQNLCFNICQMNKRSEMIQTCRPNDFFSCIRELEDWLGAFVWKIIWKNDFATEPL